MWLSTPTYRLLMSDADPATMAQVVTRLKDAGVPYQIDEGGGGIRVPASRVDELRLEILSQGLPESGRPGWEIFDQTRIGVTDFVEKANYRRALEGEIARTIASISEVASARVHIAHRQGHAVRHAAAHHRVGHRQAEGRPAAAGIVDLGHHQPGGLQRRGPAAGIGRRRRQPGPAAGQAERRRQRPAGAAQPGAPAASGAGAGGPGDVAPRARGRRRARARQRRAAAQVGHQRGDAGAVGSRRHRPAQPSDQHRDVQQRARRRLQPSRLRSCPARPDRAATCPPPAGTQTRAGGCSRSGVLAQHRDDEPGDQPHHPPHRPAGRVDRAACRWRWSSTTRTWSRPRTAPPP